MGCDIHSVAQVFKDGEWRTVEHRVADDDRDYNTFAVYANVRNGHGFAGVKTGEGWRIIDKPRGLPDGFHLWEDSHHGTWMGDHSHSWLTLTEIQKAWDGYAGQDYEVHGVVDRAEYEKTLQIGKNPEHWCGGIGGGAVVETTQAKVQNGTAPGGWTHAACAWKTPAHSRLHTMKKQLDHLKYLPEDHGVSPDQVRLVFGFDS